MWYLLEILKLSISENNILTDWLPYFEISVAEKEILKPEVSMSLYYKKYSQNKHFKIILALSIYMPAIKNHSLQANH